MRGDEELEHFYTVLRSCQEIVNFELGRKVFGHEKKTKKFLSQFYVVEKLLSEKVHYSGLCA